MSAPTLPSVLVVRGLVFHKVHVLGVQVHNVQFWATRTRRSDGKDFGCHACAMAMKGKRS